MDLTFPIIVWQAEGPQCPFGLLVAPCHGAKGKSRAGKAWNVGRNEAVGSREAGVRLFTSPEHCGTHARRGAIRGQLCWNADVTEKSKAVVPRVSGAEGQSLLSAREYME